MKDQVRRYHVLGLLAVALSFVTLPARADDDHAAQLFDDSDREYKAGHFKEAADLLVELYAIRPKPILLYNLGRAYENLGDDAKAIDAYERFLQTRDDTVAKSLSAAVIEERIKTLRHQVEERDAIDRKYHDESPGWKRRTTESRLSPRLRRSPRCSLQGSSSEPARPSSPPVVCSGSSP